MNINFDMRRKKAGLQEAIRRYNIAVNLRDEAWEAKRTIDIEREHMKKTYNLSLAFHLKSEANKWSDHCWEVYHTCRASMEVLRDLGLVIISDDDKAKLATIPKKEGK
jgi:hypothetical protein